MKSQVTTKGGDAGQSGSLDGRRFAKSHPLMECVGTLDEFRAHLALLRLQMLSAHPEEHKAHAEFLYWLLEKCFVIGATCGDPEMKFAQQRLGPSDLDRLEDQQQCLEDVVPLHKEFVVSAQSLLAAQADVVTTLVRRLERRLAVLVEVQPEAQWGSTQAFVNRLSDYLFMLARYLEP